MKRTPLKKLGKKGNAWAKARAELKKEFMAMGVTRCELMREGCTGDYGMGFAHTRKRRNVTDLKRVVLACNSCHDKVEILPEVVMEEQLTEASGGARVFLEETVERCTEQDY